jgi:hypothetical protein
MKILMLDAILRATTLKLSSKEQIDRVMNYCVKSETRMEALHSGRVLTFDPA